MEDTGSDWEAVPLFALPPAEVAGKVRRKRPRRQEPLWTGNKALLIERYLYYFVLVTKHGTQPSETRSHPVTGFHVASVHSIALLSAILPRPYRPTPT